MFASLKRLLLEDLVMAAMTPDWQVVIGADCFEYIWAAVLAEGADEGEDGLIG